MTDINRLDFFDWDFKDESTKDNFPHNICWYPSRYIPQIPALLINQFSAPGDLVVDPFAGSGTTLVEASRLGRSSWGCDINPVATFICNAKLTLQRLEACDLQPLYELANFDKVSQASVLPNISINVDRHFFYKNFEEIRQWFHPDTLVQLIEIYGAIEALPQSLKDIGRVLFISCLMPCSGLDNQKPYTYYADNVKPKANILRKDTGLIFSSRLRRVIDGMVNSVSNVCSTKSTIETGDILGKLNLPNDIQLIVTSPPYLSVTDYVAGFRLAYLWYDFGTDSKTLRNQEIGARWKRKRSDILNEYLRQIESVFNMLSENLVKGGYLCIVIGESKKYKNLVIDRLRDSLVLSGALEDVSMHNRRVNQNYFLHPTGGVDAEKILVLRKV